jgi:hypothetical protein
MKLIITIIGVIAFFAVNIFLNSISGPIQGQLATAQLEDSYEGYVLATKVFNWMRIGTLVFLVPLFYSVYTYLKDVYGAVVYTRKHVHPHIK